MFNSKSTIIAGTNRNLGKQTAVGFAKEGADILLHDHPSTSAANIRKLAEQLTKKYGIKTVTDQSTCLRMVHPRLAWSSCQSFGKVDYAISNVGMIMEKKLRSDLGRIQQDFRR